MKRRLSVTLTLLALTCLITACHRNNRSPGASTTEGVAPSTGGPRTEDTTDDEQETASDSETASAATSETVPESTETTEPSPSETTASSAETEAPTETEPATETAAPTETEPPTDTEPPTETEDTAEAPTETEPSDDGGEEPSELVIADRPDLYLTVSDLGPAANGDYTVELHIVNRSEESGYMVILTHASVNGLMGQVEYVSLLEPGQETYDPVLFEDARFLEHLDRITDIEMDLKIYDSDDPEVPIFDAGFHVYPDGREAAEVYSYEPSPDDQMLVDNATVRMILTDIYWDETDGYTLELYTENLSDDKIMLRQENGSLNGETIDPIYMDRLPAGEKTYSRMYWYPYDLKLMGLTMENIDDVRFDLYVDYDAEDGNGDTIMNVPIHIEPR